MMTDFNATKQPCSGRFIPAVGYADGTVVHHRLSPRKHLFSNRMYWHLIDLKNMADWTAQSKFRSHNGSNIYAIHDGDYVNHKKRPIYEKIGQFLQQHSDQAFNGKILLMTHPRYFGVGFNSVSFYLCYEHQKLVYIVSEINNTPWGEKHLYFHDCRCQDPLSPQGGMFEFDKAFHISPYVEMAIRYQWQFEVTQNKFRVHMKLFKDDAQLMYVGLNTRLLAITEKRSQGLAVKRPAQAWKMWLSIYYQAFRLWLKRIPFQDHPKNHSQPKIKD